MGATYDNGDTEFCINALPGNYRLYVNDGILTTGITVGNCYSGGWADYVFEDPYILRPLAEAAAFVK